jgi:hypothetical protein
VRLKKLLSKVRKKVEETYQIHILNGKGLADRLLEKTGGLLLNVFDTTAEGSHPRKSEVR